MAQNVYLVSPNLDATGAVLTASSELKEWNLKVADGEVGFFRAIMPATLRKIGKGTLEIDADSSVSNAMVVAGTVCVKAPFTVSGTLSLAEGTMLKVMGRLTVGKLVDNGAALELCEGGEIVYATEGAEYLTRYTKTGGTLVKEGAGTLTVYDPTAFAGDVCVKEGTLDFSALGRAEKFWRFTFTEAAENYDSTHAISLGDIVFFRSTDPESLAKGSDSFLLHGIKTWHSSKTIAPKDMQEGSVSLRTDVTWRGSDASYWLHNPVNLFDNSFDNNCIHLNGPALDPQTGANLCLILRLPSDTDLVYSYDLVHAYNANRPKSWTFEVSSNGVDWVLADQRTNQAATKPNENFSGFSGGTEVAKQCFVLPLGYKSAGVANMPSALGVRVDAGAAADFSNVVGGQRVKKLIVDPARGIGRLSAGLFVENGTVALRMS